MRQKTSGLAPILNPKPNGGDVPGVVQEPAALSVLRGALVSHRVFSADGWGAGKLQLASGGGEVSVIGKLLTVRVGDTCELTGSYVEHPRYGAQFKVQSCTPVQPDTINGVVLWMASRLPDIGRDRATALVGHFGTALWTVIEREPQRLTEIPGITAARADAIAAAYKLVAHEREHMTTLRGWGLTDGQVAKCMAEWGTLAVVVERIRSDPYELAQVVDGFGFKRADRVATAMGIARDAPARIRAAILFVLDSSAQNEGHCYLAGARLRQGAADLLGVSADLIVQQIFAVCELRRIVRRGWRVYTARLDKAEAACAAAIENLLGKDEGTAA